MKDQQSPSYVARLHALALQRAYPTIFEKSIGFKKLEFLSKLLHVNIEKTVGSQVEGRLEIREDGNKIIINKNLSRNRQIQTWSHELGHLILKNKCPELEKLCSLQWKEIYANWFANELCVPITERNSILKTLNNSTSVKTVVDLANTYGMHVTNFLKIMFFEFKTSENEKSETDNLWLVTKWVANRYTKLDPKLRIISAYFDSSKYFLPENQGLNRVIDDIGWLGNLETATEKNNKGTASIQVRKKNSIPEYFKATLQSDCFAMRLNESKSDESLQIVLLIKLKP